MKPSSNAHTVTTNIKPKNDAGTSKGAQPSRRDFYKNVRVIPPSSVLEIVGNRLNYATNGEGIDLGSLELKDGYSVVPNNFSRESHSGCYGFTYCEVHKAVC